MGPPPDEGRVKGDVLRRRPQTVIRGDLDGRRTRPFESVLSSAPRPIRRSGSCARQHEVAAGAGDEAFDDLLKKHRRLVTLKQALRQSAQQMPANDPA